MGFLYDKENMFEQYDCVQTWFQWRNRKETRHSIPLKLTEGAVVSHSHLSVSWDQPQLWRGKANAQETVATLDNA